MAMHTRAPWVWFNYPDGRKLLAGGERGVIHCHDGTMDVTLEDQDLIAAAPDLLSACRAVAEAAEWEDAADWKDAKRRLVGLCATAASKAKGEHEDIS